MFKGNMRGMFCGACCAAMMLCGGDIKGMMQRERDGSYSISLSLSEKTPVFGLKKDGKNYKPVFTWGDNGPEATFKEYCKFNPCNLPTTRQELDDLYSSYLSIVNAGNDPNDSYFFYRHAGKISMEMEFACFEKRLLPSAFEPRIRAFIALLAHADSGFRNYVISQLNVCLAGSIMGLKACRAKCKDKFYVSALAEYNKLCQLLNNAR
ncbi:MAG: hypothetical protein LBO73_01395 [Holosporaceae bacterium]|jgi:hypothetical protein|nr:hypothetical protein [Holosporaceae bacterium]